MLLKDIAYPSFNSYLLLCLLLSFLFSYGKCAVYSNNGTDLTVKCFSNF